MGTFFRDIETYLVPMPTRKQQAASVADFAERVVSALLSRHPGLEFSHHIFATSGPDSLAPSLSQEVRGRLGLKVGQGLDLIQGCAGGCSALILASRLAESCQSSVLVVGVDLPSSAIGLNNKIRDSFSDASFAVIVSYSTNSGQGLCFDRSVQYTDLTNVVTIPLGHKARGLLAEFDTEKMTEEQIVDLLGFHVDDKLVIRMARRAAAFAREVDAEKLLPDFTILHNPNSKISSYISGLNDFRNLNIVDLSDYKNCGAATVGIGLGSIFKKIAGKRVIISSFGTGGVVTCGCWQC